MLWSPPPAGPEIRRLGTSALTGETPSSSIAVGDVIYLHDSLTGFSLKDCVRPCVVTAIFGRHVRVAGRSTTRREGVAVPASAMEKFDRDGWVLNPPVRISLAEAQAAENIGSLPEHYLTQIRFFCDEALP
jgi:hypothetical protein